MKYFYHALIFTLCSFALTAQAEPELPFVLPSPDGWFTETISFPLGFAPEIDYEGFEELRFTPGWRNPEREDFWSYVFVWWVPDSTEVNAEGLQQDLIAYYRGLASQSESSDIQAAVKAVGDEEGFFEGTINTIDTFATMEAIALNFRTEVIACEKQNQIAVFFEVSPQPTSHSVWTQLHEIRQGFRCEN